MLAAPERHVRVVGGHPVNQLGPTEAIGHLRDRAPGLRVPFVCYSVYATSYHLGSRQQSGVSYDKRHYVGPDLSLWSFR